MPPGRGWVRHPKTPPEVDRAASARVARDNPRSRRTVTPASRRCLVAARPCRGSSRSDAGPSPSRRRTRGVGVAVAVGDAGGQGEVDGHLPEGHDRHPDHGVEHVAAGRTRSNDRSGNASAARRPPGTMVGAPHDSLPGRCWLGRGRSWPGPGRGRSSPARAGGDGDLASAAQTWSAEACSSGAAIGRVGSWTSQACMPGRVNKRVFEE
jgi:hypothetical protein